MAKTELETLGGHYDEGRVDSESEMHDSFIDPKQMNK